MAGHLATRPVVASLPLAAGLVSLARAFG